MKELKFTPENLQRHLRAQPRRITTTRDTYKGGTGTVFRIEGVGYFRVCSVRHFYSGDLFDLCKTYWAEEGFSNTNELIVEIRRLYPESKDFFVYHLEEVFLD